MQSSSLQSFADLNIVFERSGESVCVAARASTEVIRRSFEQPQNGRARKILPEPPFGFRIQSFLGNGYFDFNLHEFILPVRSRQVAGRVSGYNFVT
jgi:hypothetical protein